MKLKVLLPTEVLVEKEVAKVIAVAENGSFCLLQRHIDFVASLIPGLLSFESNDGNEEFIAIDEGILVKCGQDVLVSTRHALYGPALGKLKETIEREFQILDDREKKARSAIAKLEADLVRHFIEIKEHG